MDMLQDKRLKKYFYLFIDDSMLPENRQEF